MALTSPTRVEQHTIPETMRSAVLFGPRDIRVIDRPVPQPGPGEVLEAIRKPLSTAMPLSSSLRAVMKSRATTWNELVQHKMDITNLEHGST